MKKPPPSAGAKGTRSLSVAARHAAGRTLVCIDRNQKSVPVGVGEFVSLYVGAVIDRAVHFETVIVLRPEIVDVLQYDAFAVSAALTLQLHGGHLTTTKGSVDDVPSPTDLNRRFLHFQFAPFQSVRLENHGG